MHFNELNPSVEPFYTNLRIPTSVLPWPETGGEPRHASVNSFGFGGTNAHVIIEEYRNVVTDDGPTLRTPFIGPFVFSARSCSALTNSLKRTLEHLQSNPSLDLDALSYVLHSRRSAFLNRVVFPAVEDREHLLKSLEEQINIAIDIPSGSPFGVRALDESDSAEIRGILGVFAGQGAQAAQMGKRLWETCELFRDSIRQCEEALASLPEAPSWSLHQELLAKKAESRVSEARISQPLCAAIQVALTDLLKAAGIRFAAVVGHSSEEIGTAYAAGLLTRRDAVSIAYYRGHFAHLAKGPDGQPSGMMAAALSLRDALALCLEPHFAGRVGVAASNAPASVTLSGDLDAIHELQQYLTEKGIQARPLQVDTAYHLHHMLRCGDAYMSHLRLLDVKVQRPPEGYSCNWFSSVRSRENMLHNYDLNDQYWVDNMVQPVLFSQAVHAAVQSASSPFAVGLGVGPHPALKGPVGQTIKPLLASPLPYVGCLERGKGGVEIMSAAIGTIWSHLGPSHVDFSGWREAFGLPGRCAVLKGLPSYPWDHDQIFWRESRVSRNYRLDGKPHHPLLGRQREDSPYERTW